jgi:hypothetical protein
MDNRKVDEQQVHYLSWLIIYKDFVFLKTYLRVFVNFMGWLKMYVCLKVYFIERLLLYVSMAFSSFFYWNCSDNVR